MSKHTPGPWVQLTRYSPEDNLDLPCGAIEAADGRIVVTLEGMRTDEWAANARLVAAAPDTKDLMIRLGNALIDVLPDRHPDFELVREARALLAKIEGGAK